MFSYIFRQCPKKTNNPKKKYSKGKTQSSTSTPCVSQNYTTGDDCLDNLDSSSNDELEQV